MRLSNGPLSVLLYAIEGVGAVFVGIFLSVYLAGLASVPRDVVYHSEPAIRGPFSIIGTIFIALVLAALIIGVIIKRRT